VSEFERGLIITPGTDRQLGAYGLFPPGPSQQQLLELPTRTLTAKSAAPDLLWISFAELCGGALEPADCAALAGRFSAWVIDGVPSPRVESDAGSGSGPADPWQRFLDVLDLLREQDATLFLIGRGPLDWESPGPLPANAAAPAPLERIADRLALLRRIESDEQLEDEETAGC
jgi:cell division protein ZapE